MHCFVYHMMHLLSYRYIQCHFNITVNQEKDARYTIEEFHNRSKLFPCTQTKKLFQKRSNHEVQGNKQEKVELNVISHRPPISAKKSNRAQSAKSRIEGNWKLDNKYCCDTEFSTSHVRETSNKEKDNNEDHEKQLIPFHGKPMPVVDIGDGAPVPTYDFQEKKNLKHVGKNDRPFSFKNEGNLIDYREFFTDLEKAGDNQPKVKEKIRPSSAKCSRVKTDNITPVVFNLATHQQIYGEENDSKSNAKQESCYKLASSDSLTNAFHKDKKINR